MSAAMTLAVRRESFPIRGGFRISRGSKTTAEVVVAELTRGACQGRGECVPYGRYGETVEGVLGQLVGMLPAIERGLDREVLQAMPAGAARNALDAALWDLEAKSAGLRAWEIAGLAEPAPLETAYTLSLDTLENMAAAARAAAERPLLKLKLAGEGDLDRVRVVRENAPRSRLIVDANEAWTLDQLSEFAPRLGDLGVELIEQPLPAAADEALRAYRGPVALCADESCHSTQGLDRLVGLYSVLNIKLDKTGGLTEALRLRDAARERGFRLMVGCMVSTSLAMAPAVLVAQGAEYVDLDGPLLLAQDRSPGLHYEGVRVFPSPPEVWG